MFQRIVVHPRVCERHPEIDEADVICACMNAIVFVRRSSLSQNSFLGAGADTRGRLLEFLGVEQDDGSLLIYHAMKLTRKIQDELGM